MTKKILVVFAVIITGLAQNLSATVIVTAEDVYNEGTGKTDLVINWDGSLDLDGATEAGTGGGFAELINPSSSWVGLHSDGANNTRWEASGPSSIGTGGSLFADSSTGNSQAFRMASDNVAVQTGYNSGDPITGTWTANDTTLESAGLTPGDYTWTLSGSGDTVEMSVIPEPGSIAVILVSVVGFIARRRISRAFHRN